MVRIVTVLSRFLLPCQVRTVDCAIIEEPATHQEERERGGGETDRQTDRQSETETDRQTERQRETD